MRPAHRDAPRSYPIRPRGRTSLSLRPRVCHPTTRAHVRLLGPCFKTGRMGCRPISQRPWVSAREVPSSARPAVCEHCEQSTQVVSAERAGGPYHGGCSSVSGCSPPRGPKHRLPKKTATLPPAASGHHTNRSWRASRGKCAHRRRPDHTSVPEDRHAQPTAYRKVEFRRGALRSHPFTSKRFHVLLNSLFKVLFNFPSRYLSAIGLVSVFSLRWSLPPALGCILKQPDSGEAQRAAAPPP